MKKSKSKREVEQEVVLLSTNNTKADESLLEQPNKLSSADRKKLWSMLASAGLALIVVAAVLVVGILVGNYQQAREAARQAREDAELFNGGYAEEPEEGKLTPTLQQAYYTVENGLQVVLEFTNLTDQTQEVNTAIVTIYDESDKLIAKGGYSGRKVVCTVAAGESAQMEMYLGPEYVYITNDDFDTLRWEIEVGVVE